MFTRTCLFLYSPLLPVPIINLLLLLPASVPLSFSFYSSTTHFPSDSSQLPAYSQHPSHSSLPIPSHSHFPPFTSPYSTFLTVRFILLLLFPLNTPTLFQSPSSPTALNSSHTHFPHLPASSHHLALSALPITPVASSHRHQHHHQHQQILHFFVHLTSARLIIQSFAVTASTQHRFRNPCLRRYPAKRIFELGRASTEHTRVRYLSLKASNGASHEQFRGSVALSLCLNGWSNPGRAKQPEDTSSPEFVYPLLEVTIADHSES
ncbi:unnamed protein product [Protopolystoma xenopodis]|uniref:Uncharacterized protein n=1 Tax=Protopolystoma xenopodis TaxID=117903 RepID=A0A3S5B4T0_9PLAT|nr:unnamed protein product [Protopolystoma xenopodis]